MIEIIWYVRPTSCNVFESYLKLKKEKPNKYMIEDMQEIIAHVRGADNQTSADVEMLQEHTDEVANTGCGDIEQVHGGDIQPHRGGRKEFFN